MTTRSLTNVAWQSLTGPHSRFAVGNSGARRYAPGFPAIAAFADPTEPDFQSLMEVCAPGEKVYIGGWTGPVPTGWSIDVAEQVHLMVWDGPLPPDAAEPNFVRLAPMHLPQVVALVEATRPGPFGPRLLEMGNYVGAFVDGQLVSMAGERMRTPDSVEISCVCTHPSFQGRGLARRLVNKLIRSQMQRGALPFLNVLMRNHRALTIYREMGFRIHDQHALRVTCRHS